MNRTVLLPLFTAVCTLTWTFSQAQPQTAPVQEPNEIAAVPRQPDAFTPTILALRENNLTEAAQLLRAMKTKGLEPNQLTRWETLASRVALRQGDKKWLQAINEEARLGETANELLILGAMRFLLAADLKQARSLLESVQEPDKLSEIPKRRYLELWMRLEQIDGRPKEERKWAEKLVNFAAGWDAPNCRLCHDNPRTHPGQVSTLDLKGWWVGERYSQLLAQDGTAQSETGAAHAVLAKTPKEAAARLRLAYALRALNQEAAADEQFRSFSWAKFPDRPEKKPLRFGVFP